MFLKRKDKTNHNWVNYLISFLSRGRLCHRWHCHFSHFLRPAPTSSCLLPSSLFWVAHIYLVLDVFSLPHRSPHSSWSHLVVLSLLLSHGLWCVDFSYLIFLSRFLSFLLLIDSSSSYSCAFPISHRFRSGPAHWFQHYSISDLFRMQVLGIAFSFAMPSLLLFFYLLLVFPAWPSHLLGRILRPSCRILRWVVFLFLRRFPSPLLSFIRFLSSLPIRNFFDFLVRYFPCS